MIITYVSCFGDLTKGRGRPSLKQLSDHVLQKAAVKWRYIGIQLSIDSSVLDNIKENHKQVSGIAITV